MLCTTMAGSIHASIVPSGSPRSRAGLAVRELLPPELDASRA